MLTLMYHQYSARICACPSSTSTRRTQTSCSRATSSSPLTEGHWRSRRRIYTTTMGFGSSFLFVPPRPLFSHLCLFQGEQQTNGWSRGHGVILDASYGVAASVEPGGSGGMAADMHVLKMIDGGESGIISTYGPRRWDLTPWGLDAGVGWILESGFQEIDVMTGALLFEWASLDHVPPEEGLVAPSSSRESGSGTGLSSDDPWDYFHLNSVDKTSGGDYVVSASHTSTIYRVDGKTGEVVWRVEGVGSGGGGYANLDGLDFSFQQDVRILHEADDETTLSIFDNAADQPGENGAGARHTSGKIIQLNHTDRTVRLLRSYPSPRRKLSSSQGGGMQLLDPGGVSASLDAGLSLSGNAILCWGDTGSFTEVDTETGEVALDAGFDDRLDTMLYRVYKSNWTARPLTLPALWTYSLDGPETDNSSTTGYVSWNGATEVRRWKLHGSAQGGNGPWIVVDEVSKQGFETAFRVDMYYGWTYAEALDEEGKLLGSSKVTETFVPGDALRMNNACDENGCRGIESSGATKDDGLIRAWGSDTSFGLVMLALFCASLFVAWSAWRRK
ncbi:ASST-domain-containing protein [Coniochaeta sp. 2T2.1]|nr:ASST-domain-containing protein [Coniochaeta sp. 2T2.1]